ncbi:sirohydrochlorin chelatase [Streptomyces marincola]|uniref:Cobalamin biosynthesis protein CbiX n=1 Tax=Streptomyces marincola TaxID=2878388 RepID=A0A1W7CTE6_9ACTN|nr:CbiX/SirB N-terminal domain-containing protein [Streptomyces marincola]ARQ68015.1 cobalamin biosynthesis protein CbiX [Streptomyces marincola]
MSPSPQARPVLLVVAHGSRDPRHAATVAALTARVRALAPGVRVETCFLEFSVPRVGQVLARLHAEGTRDVVAVPLLLSRAFHARTDIPAVLAEQAARLPGLTIRQADVPGPDPLLLGALERRLAEAAPGRSPARWRATGVVLAAAGSSDAGALAAVGGLADRWRLASGRPAVRPAFASAAAPTTADAVRALRADGIRDVAVAPFVIAPGRLPDRILAGAREAGADLVAPVLGDAPELAGLLLRRWAAAAGAPRAGALAG